jgi:hypothetical protein
MPKRYSARSRACRGPEFWSAGVLASEGRQMRSSAGSRECRTTARCGTFDRSTTELATAIIGRMFVSEDATVALPFSQASPRLVNLVSGGGLAEASRAAYDDGVTALIRVGPWGSAPLPAKLVRVRFLEPRHTSGSVRIALRWEATGPASGLFPVLDADLTLASSGVHDCRLALSGTYRPPLGRLGEEIDRAVLGRVAAATIRALLGNVTGVLTRPEPRGQQGAIPNTWLPGAV